MAIQPGARTRSRRLKRIRDRRRSQIVRVLVVGALLLVVIPLVVASGGPRRVAWLVGQAFVAPTAPPAPAVTRGERWRQDLEYLRVNLPRLHGNAFHTVPRARFEAEVAAAVARAPRASDAEMLLEVMRLVALVGDGHTSTWAHLDAFPPVPVRFIVVGDALVVSAAAPAHADLIGAQLVRIGDVGVAEAIERLAAYTSSESHDDLLRRAARMLDRPGLLHALRLAPARDRATYTVRTAAGTPIRRVLVAPAGATDAAGADAADGTMAHLAAAAGTGTSGAAAATTAPPSAAAAALVAPGDALLFRAQPERASWTVPLPEHEAVYLRFRRARDHEAFEGVAAVALAAFDASPRTRLIIDMRGNVGGDSTVIRPLLDGLRARGAGAAARTVVLIDGGTYSSATMNARELRALGARVVGEPTGDSGGGWGEVREFALPNSGIPIVVSTFFHGRGQGRVEPDVLVRPDVAAWLIGVDPVLEAALAR